MFVFDVFFSILYTYRFLESFYMVEKQKLSKHVNILQ